MGVEKLEYLRGESQTDECAGLFKEYQVCLKVLLSRTPSLVSLLKENSQRALRSKGIDAMIEEARKVSPNNDSTKQSKH